ncbi:MAG TPA: M28 family metallopeptidase [Candidatus Acidoferrum sp.]|nr:M28 family metallopeptidase [Candidatus Acidoferrum sp.]
MSKTTKFRRMLAACLLLSAAAAIAAPKPAKLLFDGKTWWDHVKVIADDSMEGRETGSLGLRKAEAYAVEQLKRAGLEPAGTDGFYQSIQFVQRQIDEKNSYAFLTRGGQSNPVALGDDAYFSTRVDGSDQEVNAGLVFAGNGLQVPESHLDELAGLDLKGKVVVYLAGSPASVPGSLAAHYGGLAQRWKAYAAAGAVGIIVIPNPASMDIPWSRMSLNRAHPSMDLADPEFNEIAGLKVAMVFNPAAADALFDGSGHSFAEMAALGRDRKELPHFALGVSLKAQAAIEKATIESANVVAKLTGTDPKLRNEYVVLSAHIDHVGIGEPVNGDRIYNGAMDDGSGTAAVLDIAASLKHRPEKLKRSVIFLLVTAEEKGLLGSKYFAARPTVDTNSIVADINIDMFLPIVPLKVLRVQGINDSTLGDRAADIAKSFGVKAIPDPEPLRNLFVRSDQYNFIRHGIPSVIMDVFYEANSPEAQTFKDWLTQRYHAPSDDTDQPVDLRAAALYEQIVRRLLVETANDAQKPQWKADSFFKRYASGPGN